MFCVFSVQCAGCDGGFVDIERLFQRDARSIYENPCLPGSKFAKPRHFHRVPALRSGGVVPVQKAPKYDDDFMKIAWLRGREKRDGSSGCN
jgi:hypothetical protein